MIKHVLYLTLGLLISSNLNGQTLDWAKNIEASSTNRGYTIKVDASGDVYVAGQFSGLTNFNTGGATFTMESVGIFDSFVAKYNSDGGLIWAKQMGGFADEASKISSLALDADGNIVLLGEFRGTVDFDPGPGEVILTSAMNNNIFICKLDAAGDFTWVKTFAGSSFSYGSEIKVGADGDIYTAGFFQGVVDFDPGAAEFNLSAINGDGFVSKLDENGDFIWTVPFSSTGSDNARGLKLDAMDNVYVTGYFRNTLDFDPGPGTSELTSNGITDAFICKLDLDGNHEWSRGFGGTEDDVSNGISLDNDGDIIITGLYSLTVDFDPSAGESNGTSEGDYDVFVSKFNNDGDFIWSKQFGGSTYDGGISVTTDASNNVYAGGYFQATVDFDSGADTENHTANGAKDIFIQKMDGDGNFISVQLFGGDLEDNLTAVFVDAENSIYSTGAFNNTVDFDPGAGASDLVSTGQEDAYILKLNQPSTGISELSDNEMSLLYPNPANSSLNIVTSELIESISIFNLAGELVQFEQSNHFSIDNLETGVYIVTVKMENSSFVRKLIKN
ncbi:MAG: T9SS type A sorting domain-containing protein [Crocinitomix sp.]|nr:T9SS type A sorting domain-containing protein [Crocinitomix sp.]